MTRDFFDGLSFHSVDYTVSDKSLPGSMVCDQFIFGLSMLHGFPTEIINIFVKDSLREKVGQLSKTYMS